MIESLLEVSLDIKESGEVYIEGESLNEYEAYNIVKAIGRGFSVRDALTLMEENTQLHILSVKEFASSLKAITRLKGRVIGSKGRSKNILEKLTNTKISLYGKTISIIGPSQNVELCRNAIEMLLNGRAHGTVFKFLKRNQEKIKV